MAEYLKGGSRRCSGMFALDGTCYSSDKASTQFISQLQTIADLNAQIKRERNVLYGRTDELERLDVSRFKLPEDNSNKKETDRVQIGC